MTWFFFNDSTSFGRLLFRLRVVIMFFFFCVLRCGRFEIPTSVHCCCSVNQSFDAYSPDGARSLLFHCRFLVMFLLVDVHYFRWRIRCVVCWFLCCVARTLDKVVDGSPFGMSFKAETLQRYPLNNWEHAALPPHVWMVRTRCCRRCWRLSFVCSLTRRCTGCKLRSFVFLAA